VSTQRQSPTQLSRGSVARPAPPSVGGRRGGAHRPPPSEKWPLVLSLLVLLVAVLGAGVTLTRHLVAQDLDDNVARVPDVFQGLEETPRPPADDGLTFLLVGTDSRSVEPQTGAYAAPPDLGSQPGEVLMLARINEARTAASLVSIPGDSWVNVPGYGSRKINNAYGLGGPPLLVQTVEQLTGVRVNHFGVIDFAGFGTIVDAVGGIDVRVATTTSNDGVLFEQGANHLDGAKSLAYLRQRDGLPRGDLDRTQRQQNVLRALLEKTVANDLSANPLQLYRVLEAVSRSASVDDTVGDGGVRGLRNELRKLQPSEMTFLGVPVRWFGQEGVQSVVHLDEQRAVELWNALRSDSVAEYAGRHPADALGATPP